MSKRGAGAIDKLRKAERLIAVAKCISYQMSNAETYRKIEEDFGVGRRTVDRDIEQVYAELEWQNRKELPRLKTRMRQSLRATYQHAMARKDTKAAISALRELCKVDGLYAPTEVAVSGTIDTVVAEMTSGDRRDRLAQLLAKHGAALAAKADEEKPSGTNGSGNGVH